MQKDGEDDVTRSLDRDGTLSAGIQDVTSSMMVDFNLNDILQMVMETMYRGMGFHRALIMICNNKQAALIARFGFDTGINCALLHTATADAEWQGD